MDHLQQLLTDLESISFTDISQIPEENQPDLVECIEQLQDTLKEAIAKTVTH
jgi:hypothetical protein